MREILYKKGNFEIGFSPLSQWLIGFNYYPRTPTMSGPFWNIFIFCFRFGYFNHTKSFK